MGGKKSEGLGRALIRQHNQLVQQSKDKSRALRQQRRVLESVIDVSDIDAVIEKAEEAERIYAADNPSPNLLINFDSNGMTSEERRKEQEEEAALHASSLRVPRRPPWNGRMSLQELDANERQAFIEWRRNLAKLEENEKLVLTPFEKNLDIWRQLWRVVERSDLLVMVVDARDPLFYRCPDLEAYAREIDEHKKTLLLVNKADLLPLTVRQIWANYFHDRGILYLFWSAKAASASLEGNQLATRLGGNNPVKDDPFTDSSTKIYGRDELLARLQSEAELIASSRRAPTDKEIMGSISSDFSSSHPSLSKQVIVGFIGYPNVGKSSTINALVGGKKTGVTSTPGKTKHFQTLIISDALMLCDCPGLVFPSFSSSRYEMIASGVLPIDRMTVHREAVQVVANKVPRHVLESVYNITLPKPKTYEPQSRAPLASELLRAYCSSRGHVSSSGLPDETRAARQILKDYIDGKIPHFEMPPGLADEEELPSSSLAVDDDSDVSSIKEEFKDVEPSIEQALDELKSFDIAGGVLAKTAAGAKKKNAVASFKHHRKPQRKKDRSWRVGNDNGDGMPVVRVFQKPAVKLDAEEISSS